MVSVHFWTEAPESFIAPTYCGVEAIKLSGLVIKYLKSEIGLYNFKVYEYRIHLNKEFFR